MITHEKAGLGQLRTAGPTPDYYLAPSQRPFPPMSESEMIDKGIIHNLEPIWGKLDWPGWKMPSVPYPGGVPSLENEVYEIRRSMRDTVWPHASTWNLNYEKGQWGRMTPPTPDNLGALAAEAAGTGPEAAARASGIAGGLIAAAISTLVAIASIRAMGGEKKIFWKIMLGAGAAGSILAVLQNLVGVGALASGAPIPGLVKKD